MKAWLKGGLIGGIIGIVILIIEYIDPLRCGFIGSRGISCSAYLILVNIFAYPTNLLIEIFSLKNMSAGFTRIIVTNSLFILSFIIVGVIIGLIIQKIKSRKQDLNNIKTKDK